MVVGHLSEYVRTRVAQDSLLTALLWEVSAHAHIF